MAKKSHHSKADRRRESCPDTITITRKQYEHLVYCHTLLKAVNQFVLTIKEDVAYADISSLRMILGIHSMPEPLRNLFSEDEPDQD